MQSALHEKVVFNTTVDVLGKKHFSKNAVDEVTFRRVYNTIMQRHLSCPQLGDALQDECLPPGEMAAAVDRALEEHYLSGLSSDEEKTAQRWYTYRTLRALLGSVQAEKIELAIHEAHPDRTAYVPQVRMLIANLKHEKTGLLARVDSGEMTAEQLATGHRVTFHPELHARPEMQAHRRTVILQSENELKMLGESLLQCGKCKRYTVRYFEMQTRSADESMTAFCECLTCNHKWKM